MPFPVILYSESTTQTITPDLTSDAFRVSVSTNPGGVLAGIVMPAAWFTTDEAATVLGTFNDNIETLFSGEQVASATGGQLIDQNNLIQENVFFTVSYTPPGGTGTPLTVEVPIASNDLASISSPANPQPFVAAAAAINAAYEALVALYHGKAPPAGVTVSGASGGIPTAPE